MVAKVLYKPFGLALGFVAAKAAQTAFENAWAHSHGTHPPHPTTEEATWGQVVGAAALRATTFAVTAAVADRAGATAFRHVTGFWPGTKSPEPAKQLRASSD